jgi:sulfur carrier protein ThiS
MAFAWVEFLLTDKPFTAQIEFEDGSILEDVLPLIGKKLRCSTSGVNKTSCGMVGTEGDLLSSVIITHNGRIGDLKAPIKEGDQLKVFHLIDGG